MYIYRYIVFIPGSTTTPYLAVTPWTLLAVLADAGSSGIIQRLYFPAIVFYRLPLVQMEQYVERF